MGEFETVDGRSFIMLYKQKLRDCSGSLEDQNTKRHVGSEGLP